MGHRRHTRGDEVGFDDDFEWVNAWATASLPKATPMAPIADVAPQTDILPPENGGRANISEEPTLIASCVSPAPAMPTDASAEAAVSPILASVESHYVEHPLEEAAADGSVSLPAAPDAAVGDGPVISPEQDEARTIPTLGVEPDSAPIPFFEAARRIGRWTNLFRMVTGGGAPGADAARDLFVLDAPGLAGSLAAPRSTADRGRGDGMVDAAQLARDIAEIVAVRDRLLAMPVGPSTGSHERSAPVRTSDSVPILVGAVLAFTSLIVFGAAASFVSLR
jgi:hypothetical protein